MRPPAEFVYQIGSIVTVVSVLAYRAYKDDTLRTYVLLTSWRVFAWLRTVSSMIFFFLYVIGVIVGAPLAVFRWDNTRTIDQVGRTYAYWAGISIVGITGFMIGLTTLPISSKIVMSGVLCSFTGMIMYCAIPISKKAFPGEVWKMYQVIPMLSLEFGQAAIFLGTKVNDPGFWGAVFMQESYSLTRNLGLLNRVRTPRACLRLAYGS